MARSISLNSKEGRGQRWLIHCFSDVIRDSDSIYNLCLLQYQYILNQVPINNEGSMLTCSYSVGERAKNILLLVFPFNWFGLTEAGAHFPREPENDHVWIDLSVLLSPSLKSEMAWVLSWFRGKPRPQNKIRKKEGGCGC